MKRIGIEAETPWERHFGYPRAARVGSVVAVSGTVAADGEGRPVGDDAYAQTRAILQRIEEAVVRAGGSLGCVVRLRIYWAKDGVADGVRRALAEVFPGGAPALTTVRVAGLVSDAFLVEIEADAVVEEDTVRRDPERWDEASD